MNADQTISTGGQPYELMSGHDRWIVDLHPPVEPLLRAQPLDEHGLRAKA